MTQVLSWYEGLDLAGILRLRTVSPWVKDPAKIQQRREVAHRIAKWANIRAFTTSTVPSESESDNENSEEDDAASGEAEDEAPEGDDAVSGAAPEKVVPRDAATSPRPEAPEIEVRPEAPSSAAGTEAEVTPAATPAAAAVTAPEASVEKPTSPTA